MMLLREWIRRVFDKDCPRRFVFRVDAGRIRGLSYGHLVRCLVLSDTFRELYHSKNVFLMRNYEEGINYAVQASQTVKAIPRDSGAADERAAILDIVDEFRPEWVIIDLPYLHTDISYFPDLRAKGVKIFFIDDSRFISPQADVLLNSSILAFKRTKKVYGFTQYLLGPDFFIFDEFLKEPIFKEKDDFFRVAMSFGGSDPTDLTRKALKVILKQQWPGIAFFVILGPGYKETDSVRSMIRGKEENFKIIVNPVNIIPFFQRSDLVVCAGGRTMYELLHLNKKFLPIASIEHEAEAIAEFIDRGLADFGMMKWEPEDFMMNMKRLCKGIFL